jgi:hypothetical protein
MEFATLNDINIGVQRDKAINPVGLRQFIASPSPIGTITPNTGQFTRLTAEAICGTVVASESDINMRSNHTVITPRTLTNFMGRPGPIGGAVPCTAHFSSLTVAGVDILDELRRLQVRINDLERAEVKRLLRCVTNNDIVNIIMSF